MGICSTDIRAAALVGSYTLGMANEESDIDLIILAENPEQYLNFQVWLYNFGTVKGRQEESYGKITSLRV